MEANVVALYLDNAYKAITDKTNIKLDSLFNNKICGYSKKYNFGILYKYSNCGEAAPIIQEITFPKTKTSILKKWIKLMYKSNLPADAIIETEWHNENEYGPKGGEAGCYYKIKQTKNNSKIEIWCGC
ncbi:MAG: hypothetical protein HWD85_12330 [Flavobacteriaceae bacterium]|nr:hypothetical protein [Flavobacteriaceae bacterium]